jgi:HEAT repeat protein
MVRITALRADPRNSGLLYAAADHVLGGTQVQASGAGTFVLLEGSSSWQPLAGPGFPEAGHAAGLVLAPGRSLHVHAVTDSGLQAYAPDMAGLLADLVSDDARTRAAAARQLGLARAEGVSSELLAALDDPEPAVGLAASEALGRIADPAAVPGLLVAIENPDEQVRLGAARALGMMEVEAAVEPLRAMLLQDEGLEAGVAAEALGRVGSPHAVDALLAALRDPAPTARWHVAMAALEELGEPAVGPLAAMLDSPEIHSRQSAAQALGWIGSPEATGVLVRALTRDRDPAVRAEAAWALGEIGDAAARPVLERAQLRDPAALVQAAAGRALIDMPQQIPAASAWPTSWAPALNQWQPVRWLVLVLSLAGAAWLAMGHRALSLALLPRRTSR